MLEQKNRKAIPWACIVPLAVVVGLTACGGGGGGSATSTTTTTTNSDGETLSSVATGFAVPSEISAVPVSDSSSSSAAQPRSFRSAVRSLAKAVAATDLGATTDYAKATPRTYVEERTLDQFSIIETVLKALGQTNYADSTVINTGAYKAMVSFEEESKGRATKSLQTWTVDSRMIVGTIPTDVTGNTTGDINRVMVWIPETDGSTGQEQTIKAEFRIFTPATVAADGSFLDYGEWDMNVYFNADPTAADATAPQGYFAASARITSTGSTLKVHDREQGRGPQSVANSVEEMKGILVREGTSGYGKVEFPDWESCWDNNGQACAGGVPVKAAEYAYNATRLGVRDVDENGVAGAATYKDRDLTGAIRVVHRYGLFYADANSGAGIAEGEDVLKKLSFGFPISYQVLADNNTAYTTFGYYGAWQGRHQLWGQEGFTAIGGGTPTVFTRQDVAPGETAPTYTLKEFDGTFVKRTLVAASLSDIANIPVETWLNKHFDLTFSGGNWTYCDGFIEWLGSPPAPQCVKRDGTGAKAMSTLSDFNSFKGDDTGRKFVNIGRDVSGTWTQYVYLATAAGGVNFTTAGFYPAQMGQQGLQPVSGGSRYAPNDGDRLAIDIGGSIYVAYTGQFNGPTTTTGWVQKTLTEFDQRTWQPTFSNTDTAFTPERGLEYYLNANGTNFVVKRTDAGNDPNVLEAADFSAKVELQAAGNPTNASSLLPAGTHHLGTPWRPEVQYSFVSNSNSSNFLMLVYLNDDAAQEGDQTGTVVDSDIWGLQAFDANGDPLSSSNTVVTVDEFGIPANGQPQPVQFNWEYAGNGENWGKQQFLKNVSDGSYVLLGDPIVLTNVTVHDSAHNVMTPLNLQYDGWMHGMPDIYQELAKNEWVMTPDIGGKARHIHDGTEVTDANNVRYFVKALETSLFLGVVAQDGSSPSLDPAAAVDLSAVPNFVAHGMGAIPTTDADGNAVAVKFSEGKVIE